MTINDIIIARCERTFHPDLTCDKCGQQFKIGPKEPDKWTSYAHPHVDSCDEDWLHISKLCPPLIRLIVDLSSRICCPKCEEGVLIATAESRFHARSLLATLQNRWTLQKS